MDPSPSPDAPTGTSFLGRLKILGLRIANVAAPEPAASPAELAPGSEPAVLDRPDWDGLLDAAFQAGYDGRDACAVFTLLADAHASAAVSADADTRRCMVAARAEFRALCDQRRNAPAEAVQAKANLAQTEAEVRATRSELRASSASLLDAHARLLSARQHYAERTVSERVQAEARLVDEVGAAVAAAAQARSTAERHMLNDELARRAAAGPDLDRWIEQQEARADVLRQQCDQQGRVVQVLRGSGMTHRVAGFLVWAGYLGMAAFGWRVGEVLHAQTADPSSAGLVQFLLAHSSQTFTRIGMERSLWWVTAFAVLCLVGAPLVILAFDRLIAWFDPAWRPAPPENDGRTRAGRRRSTDGDAESRGADLTWDSVVSSLHGHVDRSHYRKHLARLPLLASPLLLALVALVFFSLSGTSLQAQQLPLNSLLFLFVGIALAAMTTGVACLVVGAVLHRRLVPAEGREGKESPFVALWPLGLLAAAVMAWTIARGFGVPAHGPWDKTSLSGPAFLLLANALMLAHGLVHRNLHRDWLALRRNVTEAEEKLRKLRPHALLTAGDLEPTALHLRWRNLYGEVTKVWEAQDDAMTAPLAPPAAGEDPNGPVARDHLLDATEVTRQDGRLSPDLAAEVLRLRVGYEEARGAVADAERRAHGLRSRIGELEGDALDRRIGEVRAEVSQIRARGDEARAAASARFTRLRLEAEAAYQTGEMLRAREAVIRADPALATLAGQEAR